MNEIIRGDILKILHTAVEILRVKEKRDVFELKELSNHTIHNASIFQDKDSVSIAVLIYSLSKIIEREGFIEKGITDILKNITASLEKKDFGGYRNNIKYLFKKILAVDTKLRLYTQKVIDQAQIKKGSKLYEHGISLAQSAEILGISNWELMDYIGKTRIADMEIGKSDVRNRLILTRKIFNLK